MADFINRGGIVTTSLNKSVLVPIFISMLNAADLDDGGVFIAKTIPNIVGDTDPNNDGVFTIERGAEVLLNLDLGEHPIAAGMMPNSEVPSFASGGWTADNSQITADDTSHTADET